MPSGAIEEMFSGYADELEDFDQLLGQLLGVMDPDTLLIITADHGNDPTYKGTDSYSRVCTMFNVFTKYERTWNIRRFKFFWCSLVQVF